MDELTLSKQFVVKRITEEDAQEVYLLEKGNPLYFAYCPPEPSLSSVMHDMHALPPGKTYDDKLYVGFYRHEKLIGIMDLILHYPVENSAYIGLFMTDKAYQNKGVGSIIIEECLTALKEKGFSSVRLGYMKGNIQSRNFWMKNRFVPTGEERENDHGMVVMMERKIV